MTTRVQHVGAAGEPQTVRSYPDQGTAEAAISTCNEGGYDCRCIVEDEPETASTAEQDWIRAVVAENVRLQIDRDGLAATIKRERWEQIRRVNVGDEVRVILEGWITDIDEETGVLKLQGAGSRSGHIIWEYQLHWATDFYAPEVVE